MMDNVREVGVVTVTVIVADDAAEYVESPASSARILHDPVFDESAVNVDPETEQYKVPDSTTYVVVPGDPADTLVLNDVVWPVAIVDDAADAVTVRNVFPVVNDKMSP